MTNAPQQTPTGPETAEHLDNLARLHRMSRTAGLGTTDYAAVNIAAVIGGILGLASVFAMVDKFFLLIPAIGVIIAVIAIRQIKASNGTQTGMLIAVVGLVLCGVFTGVRGYQEVHLLQVQRQDRAQLSTIIEQFGTYLAADKYDDAYKMLDARMRDRVSRTQFEQFLNDGIKQYLGEIKSAKSNGLFEISDADQEAGTRMAQGFALIVVAKQPADQPIRAEIVYRYASDEWRIFDIKEWFANAKGAAGQAPGGQPPAGQPAGPPG